MTSTTPSPAPLRFALVPIEATAEMRKAGVDAFLDCGSRLMLNRAAAFVNAGISASPGNDLLQRIVRARDNLQSVSNCRGSEACDVMDAVGLLADVLSELGGGQ